MNLTNIIDRITSFTLTPTTQSLRIVLKVYSISNYELETPTIEKDWHFDINRVLQPEEIEPYLLAFKSIVQTIIDVPDFDISKVTVEQFNMIIDDENYIESIKIDSKNKI